MSLPSRKSRISIRLATWLICAAIWQCFALIQGKPKLFPTLENIVAVSLPEFSLFDPGIPPGVRGALIMIGGAAIQTIGRITVGLTMGSVAGFLCASGAYLIGANRQFSRMLLGVARGVPLLALIPLFMFWFGQRETGMYLYIAFGVFVVISAVLYEAFCNVPIQYLHEARLLRASRLRAFATVEFRAIQPQLISAFREIAGLSWAFSLGAEYLTARSGLGYLVAQSYLYADMGKLLIMAAVYSILAYSTYLLLDAFSAYAGKWYIVQNNEGFE